MSMAGTTNGGIGTYFFGGNTLTASSGNLSLTGSSNSSNGVFFVGTDSVTNVGAGTLSISGTSSTYRALEFYIGSNVTVSGNTQLSGTANSGSGVFFNNSSAFTDSSGDVTLNGTSTSGVGTRFAATRRHQFRIRRPDHHRHDRLQSGIAGDECGLARQQRHGNLDGRRDQRFRQRPSIQQL